MHRSLLLSFLVTFGFLSVSAAHTGHDVGNYSQKAILADLSFLKDADIPVFYSDQKSNLGYAYVTPAMEGRLSTLAHQRGKCAGFEALDNENITSASLAMPLFQGLHKLNQKNKLYSQLSIRQTKLEKKPLIENAIADLKAENLKTWVEWLSNYPSRYNQLKDPNKHVVALVERLQTMLAGANFAATVETIDHNSTKQKSIRVTIPGSTRPNEVIVMGAHLDSVNMYDTANAPGADDNASGSANLLEALRVLINQTQPQRTIELYWYAGEESGLLGSAEIAKKARANKKDVIAVLQLDMTLFPGEGEFTIGSITDYTSTWLRDYLVAANEAYLNIKIVEGDCGYGCSDHASWYRQEYPTLFPFEARIDSYNENIHSSEDKINSDSDFKHSLVFSKIAVIFAMDLANSEMKQPF